MYAEDSSWIPVVLKSDDPSNTNKGTGVETSQFNNILAVPLAFDLSDEQVVQVALYSWSYTLNLPKTHTTAQYSLYTDFQSQDVRVGGQTTTMLLPYVTLTGGEGTYTPSELLWQNTNIDRNGIQNMSVAIQDTSGAVPGTSIPNDFVAPGNFVTLMFRVTRQVN